MKTSPASPFDSIPRERCASADSFVRETSASHAVGGPSTYDRPTDFFIGAHDLIDLLLFLRGTI